MYVIFEIWKEGEARSTTKHTRKEAAMVADFIMKHQ
jgi:hypothetical protein